MRYLPLLLLALLMLACKQSEQMSTPPILPTFSCADTTDDGQFETWDSAERGVLLNALPTTYTIPDSVVPGYIRKIDMVSRTVSLTQPEFTFRAAYDTGRDWIIDFTLVDQTTGNREAYGSVYRRTNAIPDTVVERVSLSSGTGATAGCKRLYYCAGKTKMRNPTTPNLTTDYNMDILFKGHYDVEVK